MLEAPEQVARFYVFIGYELQDCIDGVREEFPDADAERVVIDAAIRCAAEDLLLDLLCEAEERAAVAAERDLGRSMHDPLTT